MKPGNKIRSIRRAKFLSLDDIHLKSKRRISQSKLSRIERNISLATEEEKRIIARILKTAVEELF